MMVAVQNDETLRPMTQRFSELVSDYLMDIAYALRHPEQVEAPRRPERYRVATSKLASVEAEGAQAVLPSANVEHLAGGSHVVEDELSEPKAYYIYARQNSRAPFRYRAALGAEVEIARFVENAYATILERPADEAGRGNYVMMLREGYLRPIELLKTLAASDEFLNRQTRVVMVPESSQWLSRQSAKIEILEIRTAMDQ